MYKVAVVEDEELIRTMIKINLEQEDCRVSSFPDAEEMLDDIADEAYDLIMLDITLPGISGEGALKQLRERGIKTPVIMVTAKTDINTKVNSFDCGADDYIAKPFNMQEVIVRAKALIRRSRKEEKIVTKVS